MVKEGTPDPTQFDAKDKHYDPKAKAEDPRWFGVTIKLRKKFAEEVPLPLMRETLGLAKMPLLQRGQRLSVQSVGKKEFDIVCRLGGVSNP